METETIQGETIQGNRVIADLDGWLPSPYSNTPNKMYKRDGNGNINKAIHVDQLQYHTSWDWLMPVVQKIEWLDSKDIDCRVTIERQECRIYFDNGIKKYERLNGGMPKIQTVWLSIIEFINWYNKNKTNG